MNISTLFTIFQQDLHTTIIPQVLYIVANSAPLWLPLILWKLFWPLWVDYVRAENFLNEKYVLLEIKLPKETLKSPQAMELFLTALHQSGGEGSWYDKYWLGRTRPWFSLELISIEGNVHLFIWSRAGWKNFIESSLYVQFPGIEVHDRTEDDYARSVTFDGATMSAWACEMEFTKPDAYPIKTYVDYGLDKDPKEEFKVDPLAPLLEFLGSVGANQQVWIQILVRAHKAERLVPGLAFKYEDAWKKDAEKLVNTLLLRNAKTKVTGVPDAEGRVPIPTFTKGEQETVAAIERSLTKIAFDVGIRTIYISQKDFFNISNIGGLTGSFKQFNSESLNGIKPIGYKLSPAFSFPWQDFKDRRKNKMRAGAIAAYKRRSYFYPPFGPSKTMVMNSEELATIFHFPGQVAQTPNLTRIASKKSEAPANLPI